MPSPNHRTAEKASMLLNTSAQLYVDNMSQSSQRWLLTIRYCIVMVRLTGLSYPVVTTSDIEGQKGRRGEGYWQLGPDWARVTGTRITWESLPVRTWERNKSLEERYTWEDRKRNITTAGTTNASVGSVVLRLAYQILQRHSQWAGWIRTSDIQGTNLDRRVCWRGDPSRSGEGKAAKQLLVEATLGGNTQRTATERTTGRIWLWERRELLYRYRYRRIYSTKVNMMT